MSTSCYFFDLVRKIRDHIKVGYLDHLGNFDQIGHVGNLGQLGYLGNLGHLGKVATLATLATFANLPDNQQHLHVQLFTATEGDVDLLLLV